MYSCPSYNVFPYACFDFLNIFLDISFLVDVFIYRSQLEESTRDKVVGFFEGRAQITDVENRLLEEILGRERNEIIV
jgi:hypothetical protein